jgi:hypothetical protein
MRRPVIFFAFTMLACLFVFAPMAASDVDFTNTATGIAALLLNTGHNNTADGSFALTSNTTGSFNTAVGSSALQNNTGANGFANTAVGYFALQANISGAFNTATGWEALQATTTTGSDNTADGAGALSSNTTAEGNTAVGDGALASDTAGGSNTAVGTLALFGNTTGHDNTAVGRESGSGAPGVPLESGSNDTFLGWGTSGGPGQVNNATAIGANAVVSESDAMVLGAHGVNVGVGTTEPQSLLQVGGGSSSGYGDYLQIPMVRSSSGPPASDCLLPIEVPPIIFAGRLVLQYDATKVRTTLWSCSAAGAWTKLAQG